MLKKSIKLIKTVWASLSFTYNSIQNLLQKNFYIPIFEWERCKFTPYSRYGSRIPKGKLETSLWQLSMATALAYLNNKNTKSYKSINIYYEAISVLLRTINAFDIKGNTIYRSGISYNINDFVKTSRIGEIGQGLSYLLAQKKFDCLIFDDLDEFIKRKGIIIPATPSQKNRNTYSGKTADFIAFKKQNSIDAIIIECKAGFDVDIKTEKSKISSALPQLRPFTGELLDANNNAHAKITSSYATCTGISEFPTEPFISYLDPETPETKDGNIDDTIRKHYAKFFILSGELEIAESLKNNMKITIDSEILDKPSKFDGYIEIADNSIFKTYLSSNALRFLTGESDEISTKMLSETEPHVASFSDGTIFELNVGLLKSIVEIHSIREILENF